MSPADPRHRSVAGYRAGCRRPCCRNAINRYNQTRRTTGAPLTMRLVDATGTRRRLRALVALGWSFPRIEQHSGMDRTYLRLLARGARAQVTDTTEARVIDLYDDLSMRLPSQNAPTERQGVSRARAHAAAHGWLPPLALDDDRIDDPTYQPTRHLTKAEREQLRAAGVPTDYDHALVERVVAGEPRTRILTRAEAAEVCRRLVARGVGFRDLERVYGLKPERYLPQTPAATASTPAAAGPDHDEEAA